MSPAKTEKILREKRVFVHFDKETHHFYLHSLFQSFLKEQFSLLPEAKQKEIYLTGGKLAEQGRGPGKYPVLLLPFRRMGKSFLHAPHQLRNCRCDR